MELLLLSNSTMHGRQPLEHAYDAIRPLADGRRVLFVPYALADRDGYTRRIADAFAPLGSAVVGIHTTSDPVAAVGEADMVYVGGGNTWRLVSTLQELGLIEAIRERVLAGMPYMGASAGTNVACPTIKTTNDMPIVEPVSFAALGLIDFQINPHYTDPDPSSTHMGETRETRIVEFLEENAVAVLGLREGGWLRVSEERIDMTGSARLFRRGAEPVELTSGDISGEIRQAAR